MTFKRRLLATLTLSILAIMVGLAFFALPTQRRAAATTYLILTPTPSLTPPPLMIGDTLDPFGQPRLPIIENRSGRLLFTYRLNLYLAAFDDEPAQLIAQDVKPSAVHVAPDQQSLVYSIQRQDAIGQNITIVNLVDLETLSTSTLMTFYGRVRLIRWSPDGAWVAIDLLKGGQADDFHTLGTLVASRTQPVPPNLLEDFTAASWLSDNRLLLSYVTDPNPAFAVYDPATQSLELLNLPEEQSMTVWDIHSIYAPSYGDAVVIFSALGLNPVWTPTYAFAPLLGVSPDGSQWVAGETAEEAVCQPYQVVLHTVADNSTTTLAEFTEPYTLRLSNFQWAADDSLYFVRWSSSSCPSQLDNATIQLYRLVRGEVPVLLGGNLLAEVFLHTYAVAPDGQSVAWVAYDGQDSYLATIDRATGVEQRLMTLTPDFYPYGFTSVWWIE